MIHMTDRPNIHMRLAAIKFFLAHNFISNTGSQPALPNCRQAAGVPLISRASPFNLRDHLFGNVSRGFVVSFEVHT